MSLRPDPPHPRDGRLHEHVPCPFCSLMCDDLRVAAHGRELQLLSEGCPTASEAFARLGSPSDRPAEIAGSAVGHEEAIAHAAQLLAAARHPLFAGLGTDVSGMRQLLALGDRLGATLDHMDSEASLRNLLVLQDSGWVMTTLAELQNRADFVLVLGAGIAHRYPRLFRRHVFAAEALSPERREARQVCVLGGDTAAAPPLDEAGTEYIPCPMAGLGEVAAALRALLDERPLQAERVNGLPVTTLVRIATRLREAAYGVVIWAPSELAFAHADLTVHAVAELIKRLNRTTRCNGLSIGGEDGGTTAYQVSTWQTGYPLRLSFRRGHPDYDPQHYATARLLAQQDADVLLWVSAFSAARLPPRSEVPTLVLGPPQMRFDTAPAVYIPVATPGIDHRGALFRCDGVVALPLRQLRDGAQPSVAQVIHAIAERLG